MKTRQRREPQSVVELQRICRRAFGKGGLTQNLAHWPLFGGSLQRNGRGEGDTAYMERAWAMPTVEGQQSIRDRLTAAVQQMEVNRKNQAILPGFFPA